MRKKVFCLVLALTLLFGIGMATAAEKILEAKISDMTESITKTGNEYVRFIIQETRMLQGVSYPVGVPVMVFDKTLVEKAKTYKTGDTVKAIVKERSYQGRESYTLLGFLPTQ